MNPLSLLIFSLSVAVYAQNPIWSVTGGPMGIGSAYDIVSEQMTFPVYKWNYATENTVRVRGNTYLIPDEVFGYSSPGYKNDSRIFLMDSYSYYYKEYVTSWGISAGLKIDNVELSMGFNQTKGQIQEIVKNKINYFAENVLSWSEFLLQLWPGQATLDQRFLDQVRKLPKDYNPAAYGQFIRNFGTHVIDKAWYGALINFTSVFAADLVKNRSSNWAENQVRLSIGWNQFNLGLGWNSQLNNTRLDNSFIQNSKNVTIIQGGQPDVLESDGFKAWFQTVVNDYSVIFSKSQLEPLYKVVPDPIIAAHLKTATISYGTGKLRLPIAIKLV